MIFVTAHEEAKQRAIDYIQSLKGVWDIQIVQHKKSRSVAQNKLMWLWLGILSTETGNTPDDLHEILKVKFLGVETRMIMGTEIAIAKSTAKLSTKEFTAYLDRIEVLASSIGIRLPHPEVIYDEAMK